MITYLEQEGGHLTVNGLSIPAVQGNRHYREALKLVESGNATIEAWEDSVRQLSKMRAGGINGIKSEAIKRIGEKVNIVPEIDMAGPALFCYQHSWPTANASAALIDGKAVFEYAKTKIGQARNATKAQLEAYDPKTDVNWP